MIFTKISIFKQMKISKIIATSGLLTFLYLIELCIGARTVYFAFTLWNSSPIQGSSRPSVSWILVLASFLVCLVSSFTINIISALWEQKQLEEQELGKNPLKFAFHTVVGGMVWRYACLWFIDKEELQNKEALLLSMVKFLNSQFFTIPLVIVHVCLVKDSEELAYVFCSVLSISLSLILISCLFYWCKTEVTDLQKWNFETVNLVPLIFSLDAEDAHNADNNAGTAAENGGSSEVNRDFNADDTKKSRLRILLTRSLVFFQTITFSFGRLLALGILLKLAGIYAVSIMLLQLLVSVIYLKFQVPLLVSDDLSKWRQFARFLFMSYILIFEWQLNRDPKFAYDISRKIKHRLVYYCVATAESVFYLVTWAVTTCYMSKDYLHEVDTIQNKFVRDVILVGNLCLLFSMIFCTVLLFRKPRRLNKFLSSVKQRCRISIVRIENAGSKIMRGRNADNTPQQSNVVISDPMPVSDIPDYLAEGDNLSNCELSSHNSYRDLRQPIDDEIEIYVRKMEHSKRDTEHTVQNEVCKPKIKTKSKSKTDLSPEPAKRCGKIKALRDDITLKKDSNEIQKQSSNRIDTNSPGSHNTVEKAKNSSPKTSKLSFIPKRVNEKLNKISSVSHDVSGTIKTGIQKKLKQLQNLKIPSPTKNVVNKSQSKEKSVWNVAKSADSTDNDNPHSDDIKRPDHSNVDDFQASVLHEQDNSDDYFEDKYFEDDAEFDHEQSSYSSEPEPLHIDDEECPCFVCRTVGNSRLRRRRSSSVPPEERRRGSKNRDRSLSNPNVIKCEAETKTNSMEEKLSTDTSTLKPKQPLNSQKLSLVSQENREEYFV